MAVKEESEAGMLPRSALKWRKRPESAESSDIASGMNPDSDRPCNEMFVTLPAAPQKQQKLSTPRLEDSFSLPQRKSRAIGLATMRSDKIVT